MASITQAQVKFLKDNLLPTLGEDRGNELTVLEGILAQYANAFIGEAVRNINENGSVSKGTMASDLEFQVTRNGASYEIAIGYPTTSPASEYYDFQNKGVNGTKRPQSSPYSFKTAYPSRKMVTEILLWLRTATNANRNEDQKDNLSALQKKRKKLSQVVSESTRLKSTAYAIATSIKIEGITPTRFFDDAITATFNKDFINVLGKALAADVSLKIIPTNGNNN